MSTGHDDCNIKYQNSGAFRISAQKLGLSRAQVASTGGKLWPFLIK